MALISKSRPGREDGGYTRLLGNPALGALISRIHASAIAAGNELEKIIPQHALLFQSADITRFVSGALPPGNYLVCKRDIRQHFKPMIGSSVEPDFLLICILGTRIYVIELKDGDQFDTKKSFAEVQHLAAFRKDLVNWLRRTEALSQFGVEFKVCFFNARTRFDFPTLYAVALHEVGHALGQRVDRGRVLPGPGDLLRDHRGSASPGGGGEPALCRRAAHEH